MLEMRPHCEKCSTLLPFDSREALICSYECTFCQSCGEGALAFRCPNCNGELLRRPSRKPPSARPTITQRIAEHRHLRAKPGTRMEQEK